MPFNRWLTGVHTCKGNEKNAPVHMFFIKKVLIIVIFINFAV